MEQQSIQRHEAPRIAPDTSEGPWGLFLSFFKKHPGGPWFVLISLSLIGATVFLSYMNNLWLGKFFGFLQSLNATGFYHSVLVLGAITLCLLTTKFFLEWILGRMRIAMNTFYRRMLFNPHEEKGVNSNQTVLRIQRFKDATFNRKDHEGDGNVQKQASAIAGFNLYDMTMQCLEYPVLLKKFTLMVMYGIVLFRLLPLAQDSLWGLHAKVAKPVFVFLMIYAIFVGFCAYGALRYVHRAAQQNRDGQNRQSTFFNNLLDDHGLIIDSNHDETTITVNNTATKAFDQSFFHVLKSWTAYSTIVAIASFSASILPWLIMGYVYFKGMIALALMMQASIAIMAFFGKLIGFVSRWRRLAKFQTNLERWSGLVQCMRALQDTHFCKKKFNDKSVGGMFKYVHDKGGSLELQHEYQYQITGNVGVGKSMLMKQMLGVVASNATLSCSKNFDVLYRPQSMNQSMLMTLFSAVKNIKIALKETLSQVMRMRQNANLPEAVSKWLDQDKQGVKDKQAESLSQGTRQWLLNLYILYRVQNWKKQEKKPKKPLLVLMDEPHASTQCGQKGHVDFISETANVLAGEPATLVYIKHKKTNTQKAQSDSKGSGVPMLTLEGNKMEVKMPILAF